MPRRKKKEVISSQFADYTAFYNRYFRRDDIAKVALILYKLNVFKGIEFEWCKKAIVEYERESAKRNTKIANVNKRNSEAALKDIFKNL